MGVAEQAAEVLLAYFLGPGAEHELEPAQHCAAMAGALEAAGLLVAEGVVEAMGAAGC